MSWLSDFFHKLNEYWSVSSELLTINQEMVIKGYRELIIRLQENWKLTSKMRCEADLNFLPFTTNSSIELFLLTSYLFSSHPLLHWNQSCQVINYLTANSSGWLSVILSPFNILFVFRSSSTSFKFLHLLA